MRTQLWASSHTGLVRRRNEDSWGANGVRGPSKDGAVVSVELTNEPCLAVVADGLGGHPHGDVASRLAVAAVLGAAPLNEAQLVAAVHEADNVIYQQMHEAGGALGMGTTIAALLVHDTGIVAVNIGDSAVLELIDGRLVQLSFDDVPPGSSWLPGITSAGVTQTLGGRPTQTRLDPHVYADSEKGTRRFLLCSDGLTNFVPRSEITAALLAADPNDAVEALVDAALATGGQDNITVIVVESHNP